MSQDAFEIRVCGSCGLRYPLVPENPFGKRCPACLGETSRALIRTLSREHSSTAAFPHGDEGRAVDLTVLLDNVRSAWNVGSILRSADGFGFRHAYLCGITPTPDQEAVTKTSLGAEDSVPWSYHRDALKLTKGLKKEGCRLLALEEHERSADIRAVKSITPGSVLVLGNEVSGVDPGVLELCDEVLYIPMAGNKKSFNVAIAFSIAAYALSGK